RKLCPECRAPVDDDASEYVAAGCDHCGHTGYRGRVMIYELFALTEAIRKMILQHAGTDNLREKARELGMITMRECGLRMVAEGITSRAEVLRVTNEG
ncbi:MAG: type II secretion system protein GspE, partial [Gammaproteobacteria bacterium]|nr:type II secretion system protein GspE [Gammaproteobacteria bacterium]